MFIELEPRNVIIQTEKGREHTFSDNDTEFDVLITKLLWLMGRLGCHKLVNHASSFDVVTRTDRPKSVRNR